MPKRIPVSVAKNVARLQGLKQVLVIGWDGESTHVVTYGETKLDCELAAQAQDFWQGRIREFSFTETIDPDARLSDGSQRREDVS